MIDVCKDLAELERLAMGGILPSPSCRAGLNAVLRWADGRHGIILESKDGHWQSFQMGLPWSFGARDSVKLVKDSVSAFMKQVRSLTWPCLT